MEDKIDFEIGQKHTFNYSLTTTVDNWKQDKNLYVIETLPSQQTNAHCLYKIYDHGKEKQVNFLPLTSFLITNIESSGEYKIINMKEVKL